MVEAIRFYWQGREAEIPFAAIPEPDRNPLSIPRAVMRTHAPLVLKQLDEGRFFTAAWESNGSMQLVAFRPKPTASPNGNIEVETGALHRIVLKLVDENEIPMIARLLHKSLDFEASSAEERVAARRELGKWLKEHGQPEAAAALNRDWLFPWISWPDVREFIHTWRRVLIQGEKDTIDRFLLTIGQRFQAMGWSRDEAREATMILHEAQRNRFYCWASNPRNGPRVTLSLNRATERRVGGGTFWADESATSLDIATAILVALEEALEPAAAELGLKISYPHFGPISRVGSRTASVMAALAKVADGRWPLPEQAKPIWHRLVRTALRDDAAFHPEELTAWFIDNGWDEAAANELTQRFYEEAALLAEFEESERQPV